MRAWVALILLGLPALAAPVPKELKNKRDLDRIAGSWVVVAHCNGSGKIGPGDGSIWDGVAHVLGVADIWFDREIIPWHILTEFGEDTVKLAFPIDRTVRATDFGPETNLVVWTMKRVKE